MMQLQGIRNTAATLLALGLGALPVLDALPTLLALVPGVDDVDATVALVTRAVTAAALGLALVAGTLRDTNGDGRLTLDDVRQAADNAASTGAALLAALVVTAALPAAAYACGGCDAVASALVETSPGVLRYAVALAVATVAAVALWRTSGRTVAALLAVLPLAACASSAPTVVGERLALSHEGAASVEILLAEGQAPTVEAAAASSTRIETSGTVTTAAGVPLFAAGAVVDVKLDADGTVYAATCIDVPALALMLLRLQWADLDALCFETNAAAADQAAQ